MRGGQDNKEVLTTYTGKVPEAAAAHLIPGATGEFDATYGITSDGELRTAELSRRVLQRQAGDDLLDDRGRLRHQQGHHRSMTPAPAR